jgi:argininosuccinate synthase
MSIATQQRVSGDVHVLFRPGVVFIEGVASRYSLMKASKGAYGESAGEWTAAEAHGFSKMLALPGIFYTRAGRG